MIKLVDSGNNAIMDVSNKFSIKLPSTIRITEPNGGDRIKRKKGIYIAWEAPKIKSGKVNIYYSLDDGKSWEVVKKDAKNSGNLIWKVPDQKTTKALVKVENAQDVEDFDISDRNFTIR